MAEVTKDELYVTQKIKYYQAMGFFGILVQPFDVFRDAYLYGGGYPHNWHLRRIVERYILDPVDNVLLRLYEFGWRTIIMRNGLISFTFTDEPDSESDSE